MINYVQGDATRPIGAGLAGGDWGRIAMLIEQYLIECAVTAYEW